MKAKQLLNENSDFNVKKSELFNKVYRTVDVVELRDQFFREKGFTSEK